MDNSNFNTDFITNAYSQVFDENTFRVSNKTYRQTKDTAMGTLFCVGIGKLGYAALEEKTYE